jgi:hypothetical protein
MSTIKLIQTIATSSYNTDGEENLPPMPSPEIPNTIVIITVENKRMQK